MAIAVALVRTAQTAQFDVFCSADTDLIPAILDVMEYTPAIVEVAGWREGSYGQRISIENSQRFCHWLYRDNYGAVHDATDYNIGR